MIAAAILNAFRGEDSKPVSPEDLLPPYMQQPKIPPTPEQLERKLSTWAKVHNKATKQTGKHKRRRG